MLDIAANKVILSANQAMLFVVPAGRVEQWTNAPPSNAVDALPIVLPDGDVTVVARAEILPFSASRETVDALTQLIMERGSPEHRAALQALLKSGEVEGQSIKPFLLALGLAASALSASGAASAQDHRRAGQEYVQRGAHAGSPVVETYCVGQAFEFQGHQLRVRQVSAAASFPSTDQYAAQHAARGERLVRVVFEDVHQGDSEQRPFIDHLLGVGTPLTRNVVASEHSAPSPDGTRTRTVTAFFGVSPQTIGKRVMLFFYLTDANPLTDSDFTRDDVALREGRAARVFVTVQPGQ